MAKQLMLVAEDDEVDALLLEHALEKAGSIFKMIHVTDGQEAIDYVKGAGVYSDRKKHPLPHLVLLDLKMPRKDGFAVLQWRRDACQAAIPMIAFSSSNLRDDIDRAYLLGANSYVVKPTAPERLESMVKALQDWWVGFNVTGSLS